MRPEMHCGMREAVHDYVDGRLDAAAAITVAAHLQRCPWCARELEAIAALDAAIRALPRIDPGADFTRAVMAAALPARFRLALSRWELAGLAAIYAAVVLLLAPGTGWSARVPVSGWWTRALDAAARPGMVALEPIRALQDVQWALPMPLPAHVSAAIAAAAALLLLLLARVPLPIRPSVHPASRRPAP